MVLEHLKIWVRTFFSEKLYRRYTFIYDKEYILKISAQSLQQFISYSPDKKWSLANFLSFLATKSPCIHPSKFYYSRLGLNSFRSISCLKKIIGEGKMGFLKLKVMLGDFGPRSLLPRFLFEFFNSKLLSSELLANWKSPHT